MCHSCENVFNLSVAQQNVKVKIATATPYCLAQQYNLVLDHLTVALSQFPCVWIGPLHIFDTLFPTEGLRWEGWVV